MIEENRKVCNVKTIISATKLYLIIGIITVSIATLSIIVTAYFCFYIRDYYVMLLLLPIIFAVIFGTDMIVTYTERQEVQLYLHKLDDNVSIKYIRENYTIVDINEQYVLFVDKGNRKLFNEWKLFNGYSNLNSFALNFNDFSIY